MCRKMGKAGRRLFKKYFDMDVFERNLKHILDGALGSRQSGKKNHNEI